MAALLRVEQHFLHAAIADPPSHYADLRAKVKARDLRLKMSGIRKWRHTLKTSRGNPSPRMYRWLRGRPPPDAMVSRDSTGLHQGVQGFFGSVRRA
eukprot:1915784-Amphidinium_carterae.1